MSETVFAQKKNERKDHYDNVLGISSDDYRNQILVDYLDTQNVNIDSLRNLSKVDIKDEFSAKNLKIAEAHNLIEKYPEHKDIILRGLTNTESFKFEISDYDTYVQSLVDSSIVENRKIEDEYPEVVGFSQSDQYSDHEIARMFESRDSLEAMIEDIGAPDITADWYTAGVLADQELPKMKHFYNVKKQEEWDELTSSFQPLADIYGGPLNMIAKIGNVMDWRHHFKEDLHEREDWSWNPLTAFGFFDTAEFRENPITGGMGFSPELKELENTIEGLLEDKRMYQEKIKEGRYAETLPGSESMEELARLNAIIESEKLIAPNKGIE
jgi:hypothetical protein